ncbi:MAG: hypothetical protein ABW123_26655 [Cystobacter sp.]
MVSKTSNDPRFFVLKDGAPDSRFDVELEKVEPINRGDAPRCPRCGVFIGMIPWLPPYRAELELHGEELADFIRCPGYEWLISERLAEALRAEELTGLEGFHPVEITRVRRARMRPTTSTVVPRYYVVSPCFGQALADPVFNRARISAPPSCPECRSTGIDAIHGIILEPGTWSGEDIFRPRGMPGDLLVTERFKDFVERHGFTNMCFMLAEQFVWDPSNLGPAPLPLV